jgi:MFS family permease
VFNTKYLPRIAISVYFFFLGFVFSSWASRIPDIKDRFDLNDAELGSLLFMLPLGALSSLPMSGWLVARAGSKYMSLGSMLFYVCALMAIPFVKSIGVLSIVLFFFGMLGNLGNISLNAQGISIQHYIGKSILSSLHAMWSVGAFSAAAFTDWMMEEERALEFQYTVIAVTTLIILLSLFYVLVKDPEVAGGKQKVFAFPNRVLLLLGLICFCVAMSEGAMADWSSLYYRQVINQPHAVSALGYTAFALFMSIGRFIGDPLIERWGHKNILKANGLLIVAGMSISLASATPIVVMIGFALVGLGVSSVFPVVYILATKEKTMMPSAAIAAVSSVGFVGFLIGPPIIGFVAQLTGLRLALTIVIALGVIIFLMASRPKVIKE